MQTFILFNKIFLLQTAKEGADLTYVQKLSKRLFLYADPKQAELTQPLTATLLKWEWLPQTSHLSSVEKESDYALNVVQKPGHSSGPCERRRTELRGAFLGFNTVQHWSSLLELLQLNHQSNIHGKVFFFCHLWAFWCNCSSCGNDSLRSPFCWWQIHCCS